MDDTEISYLSVEEKDILLEKLKSGNYSNEEIISYIKRADFKTINQIYPYCKNNESFLYAICDQEYVPDNVLYDIVINHGSDDICKVISKRKYNVSYEVEDKLFDLNNFEIDMNLIKSNYIRLYIIPKIVERYLNDEMNLNIILNALSISMDKWQNVYDLNGVKAILTSRLLELNDERIDRFLADKLNYFNRFQLCELIERASEETLKIISECKDIKPYIILFYVCMLTKDPNTFNKCYSDLKNTNYDINGLQYIASNSLMAKKSRVRKPVELMIVSNNVKNKYINDIKKYIENDNYLNKKEYKTSNTSLIKPTDKINLTKNGKIIIKPENFDVILYNMKAYGSNEVIYGKYPNSKLTRIENGILNGLYDSKVLEKTGKTYKVIGKNGNIYLFQEFTFNNRTYVRTTNNDEIEWIESTPLRWKINENNRSLETIDEVYNIDKNKDESFVERMFLSDILEPYKISEVELKYKEQMEEKNKQYLSKFKAYNAKHETQELDESVDKKYKEVLYHLSEARKLLSSLDYDKAEAFVKTQRLLSSVDVPKDILINKVENHYEFNPEYIPLLKYINLAYVDARNLKLSGLNLKETNLKFDPQVIYNKDLSDSILSDENVVWSSFRGVNLSGANIEDEKESMHIEEAIIDDRTILPEIYNNKKRNTL